MFRLIIFMTGVLLLYSGPASPFSNCQIKYDSHPKSLPQLRGMCNVCHLSPSGSGPQNEFGTAFKNAGFMITDELVKKFPDLFQEAKVEAPESVKDDTTTSIGEDIKVPEPFIRRVVPKKVKLGVESTLRIKGINFLDGIKAVIDNSEVVADFKSDMLLFVDFIFDSLGLHDVKVKNPDGKESNTAKIKVTGARK